MLESPQTHSKLEIKHPSPIKVHVSLGKIAIMLPIGTETQAIYFDSKLISFFCTLYDAKSPNFIFS